MLFALGDWFGGYALFAGRRASHFTFARSSDMLELAASDALAAGRHEIAVFYALGDRDTPGRMMLRVAARRSTRPGCKACFRWRSSTAGPGCDRASTWDFPSRAATSLRHLSPARCTRCASRHRGRSGRIPPKRSAPHCTPTRIVRLSAVRISRRPLCARRRRVGATWSRACRAAPAPARPWRMTARPPARRERHGRGRRH